MAHVVPTQTASPGPLLTTSLISGLVSSALSAFWRVISPSAETTFSEQMPARSWLFRSWSCKYVSFFFLLIYNVPAFSSCIRLLSSQLMVTREEISRLGCGSHGSLRPGASAEGGGGQGGLSVRLQFAPSLPRRLSRDSCDCQPGESSCDFQGHGMNRGLRRSLGPHSRYFPQPAGEISLPHCRAFPTLMPQRQK